MTGKTSRGIKGLILCGRRREKADLFQIVEMLDCTEVFGSHILRSLLKQAKDAKWEDGKNTRTKAVPERNPKLNPEFHVPTDEPHKRRWHVFQILGEAADLLCLRTNKRAKRNLARRSEGYRKNWIDMSKAGLSTFLGMWMGMAILDMSSRLLSKEKPEWLSQLGEKKLFGKMPSNLWRLYSSHFVAHEHRDSVLFKRSVREQRLRFYGNKEFSEIVYSNSRKSRDPPRSVSGDETVTRLYTKKLTEIRMRTHKKNESGVLNQNICGSNDEYEEWKEGDPVGSGFTYANMAYPGRSLNRGSMFREKDMGNLVFLLFTCGDYFRGKNIELVTDSHFGHLVPVAYLRTMKIFATSSFTAGVRLGTKNIPELSKKEFTKEEKQDARKKIRDQSDEKKDVFDPYADISSDDSDNKDIKPYCKEKKKLKIGSVKNPLTLFQKELSIKQRGEYRVWVTEFEMPAKRKVSIFLHAINDSKPVFRISTKFAARPKVPMILTDNNKQRKEVRTSGAHRSFRKNMGNNDQSDAKRSILGLSAMQYRRWPKHILAKTMEDATINAYLNYLLDPNCPTEPWTVFIVNLVQELLDSGKNFRKRLLPKTLLRGQELEYKRSSQRKGKKRYKAGSDSMLKIGEKCKGGAFSINVKKLAKSSRTQQCGFCGRKKAMFKCRSCTTHLCWDTPRTNSSGIKFPANGPPCFLRFHGVQKYPR